MYKNFFAALHAYVNEKRITRMSAQMYYPYETPEQIDDRNNRNRVYDYVITPTSEKGIFVIDTHAAPGEENYSPYGCFGVSAEVMEALLNERYMAKDELIFFTESYSAHVRASVEFNGPFKKPFLQILRGAEDDGQLQFEAFHGFELLEELFHKKTFQENKRRPGVNVDYYHDPIDVMPIRYYIPELSHEIKPKDEIIEVTVTHYCGEHYRGPRPADFTYKGPESQCPTSALR